MDAGSPVSVAERALELVSEDVASAVEVAASVIRARANPTHALLPSERWDSRRLRSVTHQTASGTCAVLLLRRVKQGTVR